MIDDCSNWDTPVRNTSDVIALLLLDIYMTGLCDCVTSD